MSKVIKELSCGLQDALQLFKRENVGNKCDITDVKHKQLYSKDGKQILLSQRRDISKDYGSTVYIFKLRDLLVYPVWAYSIPTIVMKTPMSLIETFDWTSITYYVTGFALKAIKVFGLFLALFCLHQLSSSLFFLVVGIFQMKVISNNGGSICLLIIFFLSGFIIP